MNRNHWKKQKRLKKIHRYKFRKVLSAQPVKVGTLRTPLIPSYSLATGRARRSKIRTLKLILMKTTLKIFLIELSTL